MAVAGVIAWGICACVTPVETDGPDPGGPDGDGKADSPDTADNPANPSGRPARHPIILVHGFAASPQRNGFTEDVAWALCADGHSVFLPTLPPFAGSQTRGAVLAGVIDEILGGATDFCGTTPTQGSIPTRVSIIGHSMGGVDARVLVQSSPEYATKVASITTIASPHTGSAMADLMLRVGAWKDRTLGVEAGTAMRHLAQLIDTVLPDSPDQLPSNMVDAFTSIATINHQELWVPAGVHVFSWGGLSNVAGVPNPQDEAACEGKMSLFGRGALGNFRRHTMSALLKPIAFIVADELALVPNDGLVQVARSKWGTFRGCIPADHAAQVAAFPLGNFDHIRFLRNRAFELSARGL